MLEAKANWSYAVRHTPCGVIFMIYRCHLKPISLPRPAQLPDQTTRRIFILDILIAVIDLIGRKN